MNLRNTRLIFANFSGAILTNADMRGAIFEATNIEEARSLKGTNLRGVTGPTGCATSLIAEQ